MFQMIDKCNHALVLSDLSFVQVNEIIFCVVLHIVFMQRMSANAVYPWQVKITTIPNSFVCETSSMMARQVYLQERTATTWHGSLLLSASSCQQCHHRDLPCCFYWLSFLLFLAWWPAPVSLKWNSLSQNLMALTGPSHNPFPKTCSDHLLARFLCCGFLQSKCARVSR